MRTVSFTHLNELQVSAQPDAVSGSFWEVLSIMGLHCAVRDSAAGLVAESSRKCATEKGEPGLAAN
jgi:hypothetical protein